MSATNAETANGSLHPPMTSIRPRSGWLDLNLKELWEYRGLLYFFVWRDIKVRYKQTLIGAGWAIIQPLFTMIVFSVFFGTLAKIPSDGIPYPVFVYCALLPWQLFARALSDSSNSLIVNKNLLTKVYFPRLLLPISVIFAALLDFVIAFVLLLLMMLYFGISPTMAFLTLPMFLLLAIGTALAVGLWLSALNVEYRDVQHVLPFLTQIWLFATPVAYPTSLLAEPWRTFYGINPMVGVIEGFRWALLGKASGPGPFLTVSVLVVVTLLLSGLYYFRHTEDTFADIL